MFCIWRELWNFVIFVAVSRFYKKNIFDSVHCVQAIKGDANYD